MAGILDSKTRIMDVIVTAEGRRQMFRGDLRAEYASFTDGQAFYEKDPVSGSTDATDRIMFEAVSRLEDSIIFESSIDGGTIEGFSPDPNFTMSGGGIYKADTTTGGFNVITGSEFLTIASNLTTGSIDNIQRLDLLGSITPGENQNLNFDISKDTITFKITNTKPFGRNPSYSTVNINSVEPFFLDKRLSHARNFKFLPPVTRSGKNFGNYSDLNESHDMTYEQLMSEIGSLPDDNDRLEDEAISPYEEVAFEDAIITAYENQTTELVGLTRQREAVKFQNTTFSNNMVGQFFEIRNEGLTNSVSKLDVIDFGEFLDDNVSIRKNKHVFFVGKSFLDDVGFPTFINLFTLVFD